MSRSLQIISLLILANLVVLLWPNKANLAPHVYASRSELNPHFVRLNKEIEDRFYSKINSKADIKIGSLNKDLGMDEYQPINIESVPSVIAKSGREVCYRLGPFMYQESYELAQAVLFNAEVNYKTSTRSSVESNVYRLYLGPFDKAAEVEEARRNLRSQRVLDHFSRKMKDGKYLISLGIYSTQESANTAFRLFDDKLDDVKVRNETLILPDNYWLHFDLDRSSSKFQQLSAMDWGERSVKLGPHTCQTEKPENK